MDQNTDFLERQMAEMFYMARKHFGRAVRSYWLHDAPGCPGCGRAIGLQIIEGQEALSLNAFMYRPKGVLIGYLLCLACAAEIFLASSRNPYQEIPLHSIIERNLTAAYLAHSLGAGS